MERRYGYQVVFIRTDGEKTLTKAYQEELALREGITFETSAPYTPEQNGHAERQGGIIVSKARTMRIAANIPPDMWPEAVSAAGYISNRTPTRRNGWKTPFEMVTNTPPNLAHLKAYGCKAYVRINQLPKKQKLSERAHIGHLIGYDSSNIFRIWIPSTNKIICTRDVVFDETSFYNPNDVDLYEAVKEPMLEAYRFEPVTTQQLSAIEIDSDSDIEIRNGMTELQALEIQASEIQQKKHYEEEATLESLDQDRYPLTPVSGFISTPSTQSFTPQLLTDTQSFTLVRDTAAELDNETITFIPLNLPRLENCMPPPLAQYSNDDAVVPKDSGEASTAYRDPAIIASRNIDSRIDSENVILEGVKCTRKQKRQVYHIMMFFSIQSIESFHTSFNAFK